jgi:hypothetical protein
VLLLLHVLDERFYDMDSGSISLNSLSLLASLYGIRRVLMPPDPKRGKICYQDQGFSRSQGLGRRTRRLEFLATDQEWHVFDSVWFRMVWRPYLVS